MPRTTATVSDYTKQPGLSLGIPTADPEASVSGDGSCLSSATQNSTTNSTTASNGGERRLSAEAQAQASPSLDDIARYDPSFDDDGDRSMAAKLKFRRRMMGLADKSGAVRRYHRRLGVGGCGRVSVDTAYNQFILPAMRHPMHPLALMSYAGHK